MGRYRDLVVWQKSIALTKTIYQLTNAFPRSEQFGLSSQIQRAAVSIPANIAEGHDRDSTKEFLRHLSFALGSLAELETLLIIAESAGYLRRDTAKSLAGDYQQVGKMLRSLQRALRQKVKRSREAED